MSRFRRAAHGVASAYLLLAVTAIYALLSLPIALHFLSAERFGLWTLMSSFAGYLSLVDLGMSGSVARLLVDHKDEPAGGAYGRLIKTGWLVLLVQGAIIVAIGIVLAALCSRALRISPALERDFVRLLRWYCVSLGVGFAGRMPMHILLAHQRIAFTNYIQITMLALNLALQWFFFWRGEDVMSLAWATVLSAACGQLSYLAASWRLRLLPPRGAWGKVSWPEFKEIFVFGKDMFLVGLGTQLMQASQSFIITRRLGLGATVAWYAGTRAFTLVLQAIYRIFDSAGPAFSEMMVRGETSLLRERYKNMLILMASLSGFSAVTFALCNSSFVAIWTHGRIAWPPINDVLLGVWMMVMSVVHTHACFVGLTKRIAFMRYIYFIEGVVFVSCAYVASGPFGLPGIIICSVLGSTCLSGAYCVWRISRYFALSVREVALRWLAPMARLLALFVPAALAGWWAFGHLSGPFPRLVSSMVLSCSVGFYFLLRYGLSPPVQREFLERAPKQFSPALKRVFIATEG
jgi:O-antigen/teichoic acid export membrane protein